MAEQINLNLDLQGDPNNEKTVGELRQEVEKLEDAIDRTKRGTEEYQQAVNRLGQVEGELEKVDRAIEAMNPERKAQVIGDSVAGISGGFQAAVASAELFGVENEAVMQSLNQVNQMMAVTEGITAFSEKIPSMKTMIATMPRLTSSLKSAKLGFQGLSTATKALGIGLLVSAIALLVTHWEEVKEVVTDLFPALKNTSGMFDDLKSGAIAVGKAILNYLASPMKAMIKLMQGDFTGAKNAIVDGFDVIGNTADNFQKEQAKRAEEERKKAVKERVKQMEKEKELMQARGEETMALEREILNKKMSLHEEDSEEYKKLQHQLNLLDAQREKAQQESIEKRKQRYQQYLKDLEKARASVELERPEDEIIEQSIDIDTDSEDMEDEDKLTIFNGEVMTVGEFNKASQRGKTKLAQQLAEGNKTKQQFRMESLNQEKQALQAQLASTQKGSEEYLKIQEQLAQKDVEITKAKEEAKQAAFAKTGKALGQLSKLAGEQTAIGKALGVAQATIDTYVGANKALAQGGIFGIVSAASVIATGLANVKQILSTKVPSIQGQPVGTPANAPSQGSTRSATPPSFNQSGVQTVSNVTDNQEQEQQTVKAEVVETDVTNTQNRVREIEDSATM